MAFLKKLGIWIISILLSICIFTLIFGTFTNIDIKEAFGDIYGYADKDAQENLNNKISFYCDKITDMQTQADSLDVSLEELLKQSGSRGEESEQTMMLVKVCNNFNDPSIPKREFFISFMDIMSGGMPETDKLLEDKNSPLADSPITAIYTKIKNIWKPFKISLPILVLILFGVLFLFFMHEPKEYLRYVAKMFLRTGIWLVIPFLILLIWTTISPINTTPLMETMSQALPSEDGSMPSGSPDLDMGKVFFMMLPIMIKQIYPLVVFLIGVFLILIGVAGLLGVKFMNKPSSEKK
ncbi:hypothetical protein HN695_05900 [Candidatus Woesearchaeota archaeon]|jgi:hypothetical protein|nr:hypothetical protein [Candidatus Woesearchaeota archaeon]MBT5272586.1 hypothetical protein [Candidatus Woesearchaeota archaeon]MBT6040557.1 hypothetical protein [Candidatus Woesearchaeota archaeon]MBT6337138.1 hypothetical protein [Candidatus Woesearchaeota archaeon]MBT7927842.1 hypothetical protein [Candidatus Woesearchaeota archaeon]